LNFDYRFNDRNTLATKFFFSNAPQTLVLPSFLGGGPNVPDTAISSRTTTA